MSARNFKYIRNSTPAHADPETICQVVAPANQRVLIKSIQFGPLGSTGGAAQLKFDVVTQTDAAGLTADSAAATELTPASPTGSRQTVVNKKTAPGSGTEPAGPVVQHQIEVHQQATRVWVPPGGRMIVEPGTRVGIRADNGVGGIVINLEVIFEE